MELRRKAAARYMDTPMPEKPSNGDLERYPSRIGSFSKGLPHNELGEVDRAAFQSLMDALRSGKPEDFEKIRMGGGAYLVNPQASLAYTLEGRDPHEMATPSAPALSSPEAAGDLVENYWLAMARDVPFSRYAEDDTIRTATEDLSRLSAFTGPAPSGRVTAQSVFREKRPGDLRGPYISQFLYLPVGYGAVTFDQRYLSPARGLDYLTNYNEWINAQNGYVTPVRHTYNGTRYILTGRDLASHVHIDWAGQGTMHALWILLGYGREALHPSHPYKSTRTQDGFTLWGPPGLGDWAMRSVGLALKTAWCLKWLTHFRLRPEAMAGRVHNNVQKLTDYPLHRDIFNSTALQRVLSQKGNALLPVAYPEGSPLHPSYPAGHASWAGAGSTLLKAMFDENFVIPNPVVPNEDGTQLVPWRGEPLTVGGELDKLAANIGIGRNFGGVHYRTDSTASNVLGEAVTIALLRDLLMTTNEYSGPIEFTKFDGTKARVEA
ncbi:MAG: vanadium-dependent haloperoxidase [Bryobacterales bacterium]|nr:vanadium-dependent haloperoxidase [Bryobacterales bacterium]